MPWLLIIQIGLFIAWYAVPAMAALPAWVIWLPAMAAGAAWLVVFSIIGACGFIAAKFR